MLYVFQCHSPKSSHPLPLPQSPKDCSITITLYTRQQKRHWCIEHFRFLPWDLLTTLQNIFLLLQLNTYLPQTYWHKITGYCANRNTIGHSRYGLSLLHDFLDIIRKTPRLEDKITWRFTSLNYLRINPGLLPRISTHGFSTYLVLPHNMFRGFESKSLEKEQSRSEVTSLLMQEPFYWIRRNVMFAIICRLITKVHPV